MVTILKQLYNNNKCAVIGHRYGTTLVPMSEDDKLNMKYKAEKCLKALGFTDAQNVRTVTVACCQSKLCIMSL